MNQPGAPADAKLDLRSQLLAERLALSRAQRAQLDRRICAHVLRFMEQRPGSAISAFQPFRGEPDLTPALRLLHEAGRRVHLPVLVDDFMQFRRWTPASVLTPNRFGIPEPRDGTACPPENLDWVLMPLVAFSSAGTRLGMGGGYYDRSFAFCLDGSTPARPLLIGVAYSLQEVNSLPAQSWDVPLDAILTDQGPRQFRPLAAEPPE